MRKKEDIFKILFSKYLAFGYELSEEEVYLGKEYLLNNPKNGFRINVYYELRDCLEKIRIYNTRENKEYLNFSDGQYTNIGGLKADYLDTYVTYIKNQSGKLSFETRARLFAVTAGVLLHDNESVLLRDLKL